MMKIRLPAALILALALPAANAKTGEDDLILHGYEVLNGGDVVVCRNAASRITSVKMLDLVEAEILPRGLVLELGPSHWSAEDKVIYALERLKILDPERTSNYLEELGLFFESAVFLPNIELADIPDSHHIVIPANCTLKQIAIQISNIDLPEPARIIIDRDLWDHLDNDNRAALMLHEIVYKEAISLGHKTSFRTRYLNGFICSQKAKEIDASRYRNTILRPLGFPVL